MRTETIAEPNPAPQIYSRDLLHIVEYPAEGIYSTVLVRSRHCTYTLLGIGAGNSISFHDSGGTISMQVVHGRGILDLLTRRMEIEEGIFLFIDPHITQRVIAETNLALLHCVIHE